jgi:hypothetical protein
VRERHRRQASLLGLAFWSATVWGGLVALRILGLPPLALVLILVVVIDVAALVWGYDSRDGRRDWPSRVGPVSSPPGPG